MDSLDDHRNLTRLPTENATNASKNYENNKSYAYCYKRPKKAETINVTDTSGSYQVNSGNGNGKES